MPRPVTSRHARSTSGLSASPAATIPRSAGSGASVARLAITRYSVGAMHSTLTRSRASSSRRSPGSKRASCSSVAAPDSHGAMNTLRADFDHPEAAVHHTSSPRARAQPVGGLQALAEQVALAVHHRLGLAGGAAGEGDQAGVLGRQLGGRGRWGVEQRVVRHQHHLDVRRAPVAARGIARPGRCARLGWLPLQRSFQLGPVALVGEHQPWPGDREAQTQVLGAQLLGARQHDGAEAEAGEHREHPLGAVADQRHHHVAAPHAAAGERAGEAGAALGDLAEAPLAARAVAGQLDQRELVGG